MEFRKMSIGKNSYGEDEITNKTYIDEFGTLSNFNLQDKTLNFNNDDDYIKNLLKNPEIKNEEKDYFYHYMICLAINHSIIVEKLEKENNKINYLSSSPDEMALINCARFYKFIYKGIDINNKITLSILNKDFEFRLLHILEYSSER